MIVNFTEDQLADIRAAAERLGVTPEAYVIRAASAGASAINRWHDPLAWVRREMEKRRSGKAPA